MKRAPSPVRDAISREPPCSRTMSKAMESPRPVPLVGRLGGEEGIEDPLLDVLGDARPVVAHVQLDAAVLRHGLDDDATEGTARERLLGVHQEIQDHLPQPIGRALHVGQLGQLGGHRDLAIGVQLGQADGLPRHGVEVHRGRVVRVRTREAAQAVHDACDALHPVEGLVDDVAHLRELGPVSRRKGLEPLVHQVRDAEERVEVRTHVGQRVVHLVGDAGHHPAYRLELLALVDEALVALLAGAVVQHHVLSGRLVVTPPHHGAPQLDPAIVPRTQHGRHRRRAVLGRREIGLEPHGSGVPVHHVERFGQRAAPQIRAPEDPRRRRIHVEDTAVRVRDQEPVRQVLQHVAPRQRQGPVEQAEPEDRGRNQRQRDAERQRRGIVLGGQALRDEEEVRDQRQQGCRRQHQRRHALPLAHLPRRGDEQDRASEAAELAPGGEDPEDRARSLDHLAGRRAEAHLGHEQEPMPRVGQQREEGQHRWHADQPEQRPQPLGHDRQAGL